MVFLFIIGVFWFCFFDNGVRPGNFFYGSLFFTGVHYVCGHGTTQEDDWEMSCFHTSAVLFSNK